MKIKFFFSIVLVLSLLSARLAFAQQSYSCKSALEDGAELKVTQTFTAYMQALYERGLLTQQDLIQFANAIETKQEVPHPFASVKQWSSEHKLHGPNIEEYLANQNLLDRDQILKWVNTFIDSTQQILVQKSDSIQKTTLAAMPMTFYRIEKKPVVEAEATHIFKRALNSLKKFIKNKHEKWHITSESSFEMMNTLITEAMWVEVMDEPPPIVLRGRRTFGQIESERKSVVINGKNFSIWPDEPVSGITWWAAIEFANKLSIKKGLAPVYDTSQIVFDSATSLKQGNLLPIPADFSRLKINEKQEGYRLPTMNEFLFAATNRGTMPDISSAENKELLEQKQLVDFFNNSTALFFTLMIDGKAFFDLHNGLNEWLQDHMDKKIARKSNLPAGVHADIYRAVRHKTYIHHNSNIPIKFVYDNTSDARGSIGFRLVRTVE